MDLLAPSSRVAFAALAHDLGKFAQRADLPVEASQKALCAQLYCPRSSEGLPTHIHAAYTALGFGEIERWTPELAKCDASPFEGAENLTTAVDSIVNASAAHHAPETLLQWIIASADRAASGFERENTRPEEVGEKRGINHITTRQWSLFEEIRLDAPRRGEPRFRKPLEPFSVKALYPKEGIESQDRKAASGEYLALWKRFVEAGGLVPTSLRESWPLWLDAFDSLWLTFTQAVPSATAFGAKPDVSLYDHSKATAALATALWRWTLESGRSKEELVRDFKSRALWDENTLLLVQGDFFGIQNFIFSGAARTDAKTAKILRGRSFYVSLLTEACAARILDALELPPTSQIMNAAGKFLIVAPNTESVRKKLEAVRSEIDAWFVKNTCAEAGIGTALKAVCLRDLTEKRFPVFMKSIFESLERAKLQRFDLFGESKAPTVLDVDFSLGVCDWQGRWPADRVDADGNASCAVSRDEIRVGEALVANDMLVLVSGDLPMLPQSFKVLELPVFGCRTIFGTLDRWADLKRLLPEGSVLRVWDFSMPAAEDEVLWKGFARRAINGYVPRVPTGFEADPRYDPKDFQDIGRDGIMPFAMLAREDLSVDKDDHLEGVPALCHLKGDVDRLGRIFQEGLVDRLGSTEARSSDARTMNFAKMAGLSREVNAFFSVTVPYLCASRYPSIYTVFAGGDDFSFIGPRKRTQEFVSELRRRFADFAAHNQEVHFSAGMSVMKPSIPVRTMSERAEEALTEAKSSGRNAVSIFGRCVSWDEWEKLNDFEKVLDEARADADLSSKYLYSLFEIMDLAERSKTDPKASIWRSRLYYRTIRFAEEGRRGRKDEARALAVRLVETFVRALEAHGDRLRIPLTNLFYRVRRRRA